MTDLSCVRTKQTTLHLHLYTRLLPARVPISLSAESYQVFQGWFVRTLAAVLTSTPVFRSDFSDLYTIKERPIRRFFLLCGCSSCSERAPAAFLRIPLVADQIARLREMSPAYGSNSQQSGLFQPASSASTTSYLNIGSLSPHMTSNSQGPLQASPSQPISLAQDQYISGPSSSSTGPVGRPSKLVRKRNRKTLSCEQCRRRKGKCLSLQSLLFFLFIIC